MNALYPTTILRWFWRCSPLGMAILLGVFSFSVEAQNLFLISSNGPMAQRINIVVMSEGYTQAEMAQFRVDATNLVNGFLAAQPFAEYRQYFNAFGLEVASVESGSDHPSRGVYRNTRFNSSFDSYGASQFVTIPPNSFDDNYSNGEGIVDALIQAYIPEAGLTLMVVNDVEYGGAGGSLLITTRHPAGNYIVMHEAGHTLAHLGDEYTSAYPGYPDTEEPNTTRETRREFIKWKSWLAESTPVPTPATYQYANVIGLFEGAHYQTTNWFRPKLDCRMRTLTSAFCEVCSEALIKSIYQRTKPIESLIPVSTNLQTTLSQTKQFTVTPKNPTTHALAVKWFTNGVIVANATSTNFLLAANSLGIGNHSVRAQVQDLSAMVRDDPDNLLRQSVDWSLTVAADPQLTLNVLPNPTNRQYLYFSISGTAPQGFTLQSSANLTNWTALATNFLSGGVFQFTDTNNGAIFSRYYRCLIR